MTLKKHYSTNIILLISFCPNAEAQDKVFDYIKYHQIELKSKLTLNYQYL
jgi:hypothetical protein